MAFGTHLTASGGQVQLAPYFDSNIAEQTTVPKSSIGLKGRLDANTAIRLHALSIEGRFLAQGYLDTRYRGESKLVLNPALSLRLPLGGGVTGLAGLHYFYKSFAGESRRLQWSEITAILRTPITPPVSGWLGFITRFSRVQAGALYRFTGTEIYLGTRYALAKSLFVEGRLAYAALAHRDYPARRLAQGTTLMPLPANQQDQGPAGSLSLEYQGKIIAGARGGWEHISSNSIIGAYDQGWVRGYLTGRVGAANFYHLVVQAARRTYRYPNYPVPREYLDPEGPARNQVHLRLEHLFTEHSVAYLQLSVLRNETIFVNRYYNKTLFEMGVTKQW